MLHIRLEITILVGCFYKAKWLQQNYFAQRLGNYSKTPYICNLMYALKLFNAGSEKCQSG